MPSNGTTTEPFIGPSDGPRAEGTLSCRYSAVREQELAAALEVERAPLAVILAASGDAVLVHDARRRSC